MGKTKKILVAFVVAIVTAFCFAGCNANTDELQRRIEELESQLQVRDEKMAQLEESLEKLTEENSGAIYTVQEAYDNGYLTKADLMSIAYYHNGGRQHNEQIMDEAYNPAPKTPETLNDKTELLIKRVAAKDYRDNYDITEAEASGFTITEYDGTYGDCIAVMTEDEYTGYTCATRIDTIAGVNIYYNNGNSIRIWKKNGGSVVEIKSEKIVETTLYSNMDNSKDFIAICNSLDEFKEKCISNGYDFFDENKDHGYYNSEVGEKLRGYTDKYFENKAFLVCAFYKSSDAGQYLVNGVKVKSNKLTLFVKYPRSNTADCVLNDVFLVVGIDKSSVASITELDYIIV